MGRKVFISFLGTGNYTPVKYKKNGLTPIETKYVQIASYQFSCSSFDKYDKVLIFTTPSAYKVNWLDDGHFDKDTKKTIKNNGLNSCFRKIGVYTESIVIPEGKSEDEIWQIFQTVFNMLEQNDQVFFDITHSLRSIPMLNMVLINYAKLLKNISVKGIFYGAFEVESETKPIWDLTSFAELQDWTIAASGFILFGNANGIKELSQKEVLPILRNQHDSNKLIAQEVYHLARSIDHVTDALLTNRGNEIVEAKIFGNLQNNINNISNIDFIPPFKPIIDKIKEKTKRFNISPDIWNGFMAVEWCIEHNLIQQGYTMMQENILTYFCNKANLNYKSENERKLVSDAFYNINMEKPANDEKVKKIMELIPKEMASLYDSLTHDRNDINHGGFIRNKSPQNLRVDLIKKWENCKNLLK